MLPGLKTPWENDGDSELPVEAQLQRLRGIAMLVGFNEAAEWSSILIFECETPPALRSAIQNWVAGRP